MTRTEMTKNNRDQLATDYNLRIKLSIALGCNERTIQRWAVNNSPKLTTDSFLSYFKKHTNYTEPLTQEIKIKQLIEH
jgi:hypothetical protein